MQTVNFTIIIFYNNDLVMTRTYARTHIHTSQHNTHAFITCNTCSHAQYTFAYTTHARRHTIFNIHNIQYSTFNIQEYIYAHVDLLHIKENIFIVILEI